MICAVHGLAHAYDRLGCVCHFHCAADAVCAVFDMAEWLQRAAVAVTPLVYGAGVQNKVLEALTSGAPVVADPLAT